MLEEPPPHKLQDSHFLLIDEHTPSGVQRRRGIPGEVRCDPAQDSFRRDRPRVEGSLLWNAQ